MARDLNDALVSLDAVTYRAVKAASGAILKARTGGGQTGGGAVLQRLQEVLKLLEQAQALAGELKTRHCRPSYSSASVPSVKALRRQVSIAKPAPPRRRSGS